MMFATSNDPEIGMSKGLQPEGVEQLADRLAARWKVSPAEATKIALESALKRSEDTRPLRERLKPLLDKIDAMPKVGQADKAFFDDLSGE